MAPRTRRLAWWLGLPLLAVVLLVALWNWDWFVPLAEREASGALGRPVSMQHLHVRLGRTLTVAVDGLEVGNPEGFGDAPPLAVVRRAEADLDLLAFLRRRAIIIPRILLDQPVLEPRQLPDGRSNYAFASGQVGSEPAPPTPPRIGTVLIRGGQAHAVLAPLRADFQVSFATREPADVDPQIVAEAEGRYAGQPIRGRLVGGALLGLREEGKPWPIDLRVDNGPTTVTLRGTVQDPMRLGGADLDLRLNGPDMGLLRPLTGVAIPPTPPYRIAGKLDYADGNIRFSNFDGRVGNSDLAGEIRLARGPERPVVTMDLRSRRVDLTDFGGFVGTAPGRRDTPGITPEQRQAQEQARQSPRLLPDSPISLPNLRVADVHLKFRGARIEDRRVPLDNLAVDMDLEDGAIRVHPARFGVGSGTIGGTLALLPQADGRFRAQGEFEIRRADVSRLLQPLGIRGGGTLGGIAHIEGTGNSVASLLGNGNGALTVAMVGGDISALILDLSGLQFGRALLSALGIPSRSSISCLVGDFVLQRGVLETRTFVLDTDSSVLRGSGQVDLGKEQLALRLRTRSKHFSVGSLPTDVGVAGALKAPSILPDFGELAARGGAAVGLGVLFPPLALLPTIQFGTGDAQQCQGVVEAARAR